MNRATPNARRTYVVCTYALHENYKKLKFTTKKSAWIWVYKNLKLETPRPISAIMSASMTTVIIKINDDRHKTTNADY